MDDKLSRRDVIQQSAALGAFVVLGATACNKPAALTCTDTSQLAPADASIRTALGYVDLSTEAGKTCSTCQQFLPAAPGACGTCKVVKGPINPNGNCKSYVAKT
jgi:High potential iron-sulfur protein